MKLISMIDQRAFTAGAKWQQERMYNLDFISKAKI